ncbi:MAG TPA: ATP-binding protein [Candidatus Binatia bacterium]|nr:ATP-binding protein [Candidatus Binatia bacterium]
MSTSISSLRSRLILLILAAVVPAFTLILQSGRKYRELTATQIKENALMAARAIASEQDRVLENAHEFLIALSRLPQIRNKDRAACGKLLAGLLEPRYADLMVADPRGKSICAALPGSRGGSAPRLAKIDLEEQDFFIGPIRQDPETAKILLDVSYPVMERPGVILAFVSTTLDWSWINQATLESRLHPGAAFTLISQSGRVLMRHPADPAWSGKQILSETALSGSAGSGARQAIESAGPDGVQRLFALARLKNAVGGQTVYASVDLPVEIALAKPHEILKQNLLTLAALSALILASTWFGTDVLVLRRIRDIIAATKQMTAGDLGARTLLPYDRSELGQMARAFDNLAGALERRQAEASASARQIQQQRQRQQALYDLERGMTSTLEPKNVAQTLADHIFALFPQHAVIVSSARKDPNELQTIASRGLTRAELMHLNPTSSESLTSGVVDRHSAMPVSVSADAPTALRTGDSLPQPWTTYLGLPLCVKGETFGVLSFYGRENPIFTADEIDFLNALANQAAVALHNSQLFEQTREQAAELEKSNKIKDEFLGVMSHELRTPLNIIMNYAEAMRMGTFGDISQEQARGTDKIRAQAGHLLSLINGILEITKIESGTITVESRPVDLNSFMAELKSDYMLPLEKDVELVWAAATELPVIQSDPMKLKQIMNNLINNAIKFTDRGSITVTANASPARQEIELEIADTGPGIPPELVPLVFEKFRQIDSATTRNYSGAGLGLYIVKNFVDLLGARIEIRSTVGKGTLFTVTLAYRGGLARQQTSDERPARPAAYTL